MKYFLLQTTYGKLFLMWVVGMAALLGFVGITYILANFWDSVIILFKGLTFIIGPILIGGCFVGHKLFPEESKDK